MGLTPEPEPLVETFKTDGETRTPDVTYKYKGILSLEDATRMVLEQNPNLGHILNTESTERGLELLLKVAINRLTDPKNKMKLKSTNETNPLLGILVYELETEISKTIFAKIGPHHQEMYDKVKATIAAYREEQENSITSRAGRWRQTVVNFYLNKVQPFMQRKKEHRQISVPYAKGIAAVILIGLVYATGAYKPITRFIGHASTSISGLFASNLDEEKHQLETTVREYYSAISKYSEMEAPDSDAAQRILEKRLDSIRDKHHTQSKRHSSALEATGIFLEDKLSGLVRFPARTSKPTINVFSGEEEFQDYLETYYAQKSIQLGEMPIPLERAKKEIKIYLRPLDVEAYAHVIIPLRIKTSQGVIKRQHQSIWVYNNNEWRRAVR
jgi:hypothetical protein